MELKERANQKLLQLILQNKKATYKCFCKWLIFLLPLLIKVATGYLLPCLVKRNNRIDLLVEN
jgi:hypothetical protein